jgi:hypothetical protein
VSTPATVNTGVSSHAKSQFHNDITRGLRQSVSDNHVYGLHLHRFRNRKEICIQLTIGSDTKPLQGKECLYYYYKMIMEYRSSFR